MIRKGLGKGRGCGYHNLIPKDKKVHSDSAKGRKQPQKLTKGLAKSLISVTKKGRRGKSLESGAFTSDVLKLGDYVLKVANPKGSDYKEESFEKRCKAINLVRKEFPYYPECVVIDFEDKRVLLTKYEGKTLDELDISLETLTKKQKNELINIIKYLDSKGYTITDLHDGNISIDKKGNPVIIDWGSFKKNPSRKKGFNEFISILEDIYPKFDKGVGYDFNRELYYYLNSYPNFKFKSSFDIVTEKRYINDIPNIYYKIKASSGDMYGLQFYASDVIIKGKINSNKWKTIDGDTKEIKLNQSEIKKILEKSLLHQNIYEGKE